jgi:lysyl-tRNA synthetase class I
MYREPKAAKRLYFDVIPRNVDDYQQFLEGYREAGRWKQRLAIRYGTSTPAIRRSPICR